MGNASCTLNGMAHRAVLERFRATARFVSRNGGSDLSEDWWTDAIFYAVDIERFFDGNGDGIGDFPGLAEKLPYIEDLGVTCIWLLPFYPSANRDNGYDVTDYYGVDPRLGTFDEFLAFIRAAGQRGIRVIVDLVVQHTSIDHPWFRSARHDEQSPFRNYYIWSDHPPPVPEDKGNIFPGEEPHVWTFDEVAGAYYHHRFYHFQPGLNHDNPSVRGEVERIIDYWASFGISGFRIDAASHLVECPLDPKGEDPSHATLRHIYAHTMERKSDVLLMGEVDEDPEALRSFFDGQQLNMMFNFYLNNYTMLALATRSAPPLLHALDRLPMRPPLGQWANFLRTLDEADLERLTPEEMAAVLDEFAPRESMRIFDRGIRRRIASMLGHDPRRLVLANSVLFSLPGAPVVIYGDEIGMGDDLGQPGRGAVRAPMQWNASRNGGFSRTRKTALPQPMIDSGPAAFAKVNVAAQEKDANSLLASVRRLAALRRNHPEIGREAPHFPQTGNEAVLALAYPCGERHLLVVHNLSQDAIEAELPSPSASLASLLTLFGDGEAALDSGKVRLTLPAYGTIWAELS